MTNLHKLFSIAALTRLLVTGVAGLALAGCGGGGGSAGATVGTTPGGTPSTPTTPTTPTVPPAPTITLDLLDAAGLAKTSLTTSSPLTLRATVKDAAGAAMPGKIVNFAIGSQRTVLSPSAGTALTNAAGVASVTMSVASLEIAQSQAGAADTASAAVTIGDQALIASRAFSLGTSAISLRLVEPSPSSINLKAYDTTPIKVDVLADGVLYTAQPVNVNFTSACANGKADLPASASTINGRAQVVYRDKGCSAIDTVTASVPGATSVTASLVIAPPVAASIGFVAAQPSDKSIVIQGAGGNGRTETAVLTFRALDTFGQPLPNQLVTFSVNATGTVNLQSPSATTGADGRVIVAVNSGTTPTTFRVIATLPSGQSTISDTITVTTGQPVQAAFSLSAGSYNIEGWDYDNTKTVLTALLADGSGNPVADGTPVVFQTDSAAVGSANLGGCVTVNGGCTVEFRSQAPRFGIGNTAGKRQGLATINVSSTSATVSLTGKLHVFLSGSHAQAFPQPAGPLSTSQCGNFSLWLELTDQNVNPLPSGTAIGVVNADKVAIGTIFPSTVPSISAPDSFKVLPYVPTAPQTRHGSFHLIPVKPDTATCNVLGTAGKGQGSFGISVTSPNGVGTVFGFTLSFPAL